MSVPFDQTFDARGMSCPMPLVNTRKEIGKIAPGQTLKVIASDHASVADFQGWAKIAKNIELLSQETETLDGSTVYIHFLKRTS